MLRSAHAFFGRALIPMTRRILIITALLLALIASLLYWTQRAQPPAALPGLASSSSDISVYLPDYQETPLPPQNQREAIAENLDPPGASPASQRKQLEIYGRVVDENQQAIANLLIFEDRYLNTTRSDDQGYYRMILDMPRHRYPVLQFLRGGYRGRRIELKNQESAQDSSIEVNLQLESSLDFVTVNGWIANQAGVGMEGVRIEISPAQNPAQSGPFLTTFSDEQGNFSLEGIEAGEIYKLSAAASTRHSLYLDDSFSVTQNPRQLEIRLQPLRLIDIHGMIVNRHAAPVANFEMYIRNLGAISHVAKIVTDSSGFFKVEGFPAGEVDLSTQGPDYFKVSGLTLSEQDSGGLTLIVDIGDYFLSGWISDENGVAVSKALVTLDSAYLEDGIEYSSYRSLGSDSAGRFEFANIDSGDHTISIYANGFERLQLIHSQQTAADEIHIRLKRSE